MTLKENVIFSMLGADAETANALYSEGQIRRGLAEHDILTIEHLHVDNRGFFDLLSEVLSYEPVLWPQ